MANRFDCALGRTAVRRYKSTRRAPETHHIVPNSGRVSRQKFATTKRSHAVSSTMPAPARSGARKVIVTCAVTGAVHVPSQSPYLPLTPTEICESARLARPRPGAAILHLHARRADNGRPTPDPDVFMEFLPEIKVRTNAVVNITTGGGQGMCCRNASLRRCEPNRKCARSIWVR